MSVQYIIAFILSYKNNYMCTDPTLMVFQPFRFVVSRTLVVASLDVVGQVDSLV
jgi:hypothetical protein